MADIIGGEIIVNGEVYTVILRPSAGAGAGADAPEPAAMEGGKRSKKAKGTRKLSPYMKFAQEARKKIIEEEPALKSDIIKVGKRIGEMWRGLSAEEKAKY